jgi:uncharacterized protein YraI
MRAARLKRWRAWVHLGVIAIALLAVMPGLANGSERVAYTIGAVKLRIGPSQTGRTMTTIPAWSMVSVGACGSGWCEVTYHGQHGFAATRYLSAPATQRVFHTGSGYTNSRGAWVPSPARTSDNQPPPGASAQCCDGTYSFSMSRRGTCSHHGGVCRWLP